MRLVILIGLQGSGKTTFHRRLFADTHYLVSKDLIRNSRNRQARQMFLIERILKAGGHVVVDNTNPSIADRAPLIRAGRKYGAAIIGFVFECDVSECLRRNAQREGRARVPSVAIYSAARKFEYPAAAEGFDALFRVSVRPDGFEVSPEYLRYDPLRLPAPVISPVPIDYRM